MHGTSKPFDIVYFINNIHVVSFQWLNEDKTIYWWKWGISCFFWHVSLTKNNFMLSSQIQLQFLWTFSFFIHHKQCVSVLLWLHTIYSFCDFVGSLLVTFSCNIFQISTCIFYTNWSGTKINWNDFCMISIISSQLYFFLPIFVDVIMMKKRLERVVVVCPCHKKF